MNRLGSALIAISLLALATTGCEGAQKARAAKEHRDKANAALKAEKWQEAASEYALSLEANPDQDKVYDKKAMAEAKGGDYDSAAQTLKLTLARADNDAAKAAIYKKIGGMYLRSPQIIKAEEYFVEAMKLIPNDKESLAWLGELYSSLGGARNQQAPAAPEHLEKAIGFYDQAIAADSGDRNAVANRGIALTKWAMFEQTEQQKAEGEAAAATAAKDKATADEATARAQQHAAKLDELKTKLNANTELMKQILAATKK